MSICIFCKIISREVPASIIMENDSVIVIKDIAPKAPVHYLIIPKKHLSDIRDFKASDSQLAASILLAAQNISQQLHNTAFRLIMNNGAESGQKVFHLHAHFLAGKELFDF